MKLPRRRFLHLAASLVALPAASRFARAQSSYPTRPVHLFVGVAAGGATDFTARTIAERLSQHFGKPFVVENRTGMGANLAAEAVINSPPDGHALLLAGASNAISASVYKKLPFNFLQDTVPIGGVMRSPNLMVVSPSLPVKTVRDFIDYAKANPEKLSFGSAGVGTSPHLSGELFKLMTKIDMVHVPYRGGATVYPDLMGGSVNVLFDNLAGSMELVRSGRLRALGVTTASRWDLLPDVPSIAETVPDYEVSIWYGIVAPKNTPSLVVTSLSKALDVALADSKVTACFAQSGGLPMPMGPGEFGNLMAHDTEKWREVVASVGVSAE
jgi:tripartite-type tricarboxylate transporter receptor subunit TctC